MSNLNEIVNLLLEKHPLGDILSALKIACKDRFVETEFDPDGNLDQPCLDWVSAETTIEQTLRDVERYTPRLGRGSRFHMSRQ